jgi:hypothetical protein
MLCVHLDTISRGAKLGKTPTDTMMPRQSGIIYKSSWDEGPKLDD